MKGSGKKLLLLCLTVVLLMLLTGCGGTLTTKLTVDETLAGSRVMVFSANLAENKGRFHGDAASAAKTVAAGTPSVLEFEDRSTSEDVIWVFTLRFDSLEEYSDKVAVLLTAGGKTPESEPVSYRTADSVFSSGIYYTEHFGALELMNWLPDLLVAQGIVDAGDRSKIFNDNSESYSVAGYQTSGSYPYIDTLVYVSIDGIDFFTTFYGDGKMDRTIRVTLPQESLKANEEQIKAYLSANETDGAKGSWSKDGEKQIYTLTRSGMEEDALTEMMNRFYGNSEGSFSVEQVTRHKAFGYFADIREIHETIDLTEYRTGADGSVNLHYYVSDNGTYSGTYREYDFDNLIYGYASEAEGYELLFYTGSARVSADYHYRYSYVLDRADIVLDVSAPGEVSRSVTLLYGEDLDAVRAAYLKADLEVAIAKAGEGISLESCEQKKDGFEVVIRTTARTGEEEAALWNRVFETDAALTVTRSGLAPLSLRKITHVEDRFTLAPFAQDAVPEVTYRVRGIGDTTPYGGKAEEQKGSDLIINRTDLDPASPLLREGITGERKGIPGVLAWAAVIVSVLAAAVTAIVFSLRGRRAPKDAGAAETGERKPGKGKKEKKAKKGSKEKETGTDARNETPEKTGADAPPEPSEAGKGGTMGGYCDFCGKPLVDGSCDCAEFLASVREHTEKAGVTGAENAAATMTHRTGIALANSASGVTEATETAVNNAVASGQLPEGEETPSEPPV